MDSHDAQHLVCHMATTSTPPAFSLRVTRIEWFRITRELVASTISDMDLDPVTLAEDEEAFIGVVSCDSQMGVKGREAATPRVGDQADSAVTVTRNQ